MMRRNKGGARRLLYLVMAVLPIAGCSKGESLPTLEQFRAQQHQSIAGPTRAWHLASGGWARATPAMRDRAYLFCWRKRRNDDQCFAEQDHALILANHAETNARLAVRGERRGDVFFDSIRRNPQVYVAARQLCLSIYRDAGAVDARILGPCMTNAVGGDYFGIVPVPWPPPAFTDDVPILEVVPTGTKRHTRLMDVSVYHGETVIGTGMLAPELTVWFEEGDFAAWFAHHDGYLAYYAGWVSAFAPTSATDDGPWFGTATCQICGRSLHCDTDALSTKCGEIAGLRWRKGNRWLAKSRRFGKASILFIVSHDRHS